MGNHTATTVSSTPSLDLNATPALTASISLGQTPTSLQTPVSIQTGTLSLAAANGDEVHGTFTGQGSPADAAGFIRLSGTFTITGGAGRFGGASGAGTVSGVVNILKLAYAFTVAGSITPPQQ